MRILVTGGSGFIGTNAVETFINEGHEVLSIDIQEPKLRSHEAVFKRVDILDAKSVEATLGGFGPEAVIHLAARADMEQRKGLAHFAPNIQGVQNIIQAIAKSGTVNRSIFASTRLVFDLGYPFRHETDYHATTLYGQSKALGEELVRTSEDKLGTWTIVRPTGIWGPWFGEPYRSFFSLIERGLYFHPRGRNVKKSYGYVGNVVYQLKVLLAADEMQIKHKTFWLADYEPVIVSDWANEISRQFGSRPVRSIPVSALRAAAQIGDGLARWGKPFPMTSFRLHNMTNDMIYDMSRTKLVIGRLPFSLEEGTAKTIQWIRRANFEDERVSAT